MKTALLRFVKWVLIPFAVAAVGFFFLGPRLGYVPDPRKKPTVAVKSPTEADPNQVENTEPTFPEPDVKVIATPAKASVGVTTDAVEVPKPKRKKRKPTPTPSAEPEPKRPAPQPDPDNLDPDGGTGKMDGN
jgi:hypothetical protein